jgi:hypothetical protein
MSDMTQDRVIFALMLAGSVTFAALYVFAPAVLFVGLGVLCALALLRS